MVDAVTAIGIVGMLATALMVVGMLYLTFLGAQSDRDRSRVETDPGTEPEPGAESASAEGE